MLKGCDNIPLYIRCSKCGKRILHSQKCNCTNKRYKEENKYKDKQKSKFYSSKEWKLLVRTTINKFSGIDIYSYYEYHNLEYGNVVHHIETINDNWNKRFDINNLIYLTNRNHIIIHEQMKYNKQEIMTKLFEYIDKWNKDIKMTKKW